MFSCGHNASRNFLNTRCIGTLWEAFVDRSLGLGFLFSTSAFPSSFVVKSLVLGRLENHRLEAESNTFKMKYSIILSLVAALPSAYAVAFGGPVPTDTSPNRVLEGMAPEPTNGPSINELRKRQSSVSPEICGWVDGILGTQRPKLSS
jgi:hypothetical protein